MVEISRIGTLAIYNNAISNFNRNKANQASLQDQASSGLKGRDFKTYNGQVEQFVGLEKDIKRIQMYLDNNKETTSRLTTMENSLEQTYSIAEEAKKVFTLRNNATFANSSTFAIQMQNSMLAMAKELNVSVTGRYLFGGTNTELPPVIDNPIPQPFTVGTVDEGYYQGSKENIVTRIQDNLDVEYDIRADDPAFQKYFAALWLGIEGHNEKNNEKLADAQNMLDESIKGINALVARVQTKRTNVDNIVTRQKDTKLYLSSVVKEISDADVVAVRLRITIEQATLTATFQIFSRISSLNLSQYLQ
jgi:flagellar hook-associated protein 3 FlgL